MQSCRTPGCTTHLSDSFSLYITWQVEFEDTTLTIVTYFVGICVSIQITSLSTLFTAFSKSIKLMVRGDLTVP